MAKVRSNAARYRSSSTRHGGNEKSGKKSEFGRRLKLARLGLKLTQLELARAIGASLQTVKSYEGGRRTPSGISAAGIARLGINFRWLSTNEGPMLLESSMRDAHVDFIASVHGDGAAAKRMNQRVGRVMDQFKRAQLMVDETARRCTYEIPNLVRDALVLAILNGMAFDGVEPIVNLLKAQAILDGRNK